MGTLCLATCACEPAAPAHSCVVATVYCLFICMRNPNAAEMQLRCVKDMHMHVLRHRLHVSTSQPKAVLCTFHMPCSLAELCVRSIPYSKSTCLTHVAHTSQHVGRAWHIKLFTFQRRAVHALQAVMKEGLEVAAASGSTTLPWEYRPDWEIMAEYLVVLTK